ncbi:DoxX family protein [Halarchaeum nitratireducens]|uniref:DoxX family protein n=1 Tax=Halarchaeum nitratireducens TaxID=489913 RepID=A0A830G8M2_9EURY|nr:MULTISPECIES: DoxX family protein [Halarchaeum]MBP2250090.1 putative membrane protein YphA (DoxX/SURF4 family) [Halarchaeum solikamskense]GGN08565.1 hypothetical protein GCM10009021_04940 [Halarchaeum nitratireducens]
MTTNDDASTSLSRLGRLALGLGLALQATEDFRDMEDTIEYAESAGVPAPSVLAPLASGTMVSAGVGIALWRLPRLATGAAATFLSVVTLTMHDFWTKDPDEGRGGERLAFFGNVAMLGGVLIALREAWRR